MAGAAFCQAASNSSANVSAMVAAAMREGLGLLHQSGISPAKVGPVPPRWLPSVIGSSDWLFNRLFLKMQKIDSHARSSMADDLAHGRKTEIDYLNGELIECPLHQGTFNVKTGAAVGAPCTVAVRTYPVKLQDGVLHVGMEG